MIQKARRIRRFYEFAWPFKALFRRGRFVKRPYEQIDDEVLASALIPVRERDVQGQINSMINIIQLT